MFRNIFSTMMLVLTVELLMAVVSILATNVTGQLDENAKDLLTMRVRNRASYVQDILRDAQELTSLSEQINATTQQMLENGEISLDTLDNSIAYSQPLILPDGTVYGVVGVELLTEYLQSKLPYTELDEDKAGTYLIVSTTDALTDGALTLCKTVTSGEDLVTADAPLGILNCHRDAEGDDWLELDNKRYYMVLEPLQLYNRNAPFATEQWFLAGAMEQSVLLAFSDRVRRVLLTTILVTLVLGVCGSLLVSASLAMPIHHLYHEVVDAQERKTFPRLSRTAIREVDRFAETITELNKELVTNSTKFLRIMDMASVELGGYELRTVIALGADLLQGYFLARPAIVPEDISPEAAAVIQELPPARKRLKK